MIKLFQALMLLALAWFAFHALRRAMRRAARPPAPPRRVSATAMVPCAHCGLHVPEPDAVRRGGRYYCSPRHAAEKAA